MRYLADTHAFLWWINDSRLLTAPARRAMASENHTIFVSAATGWEIATKHRLGKLPEAGHIAHDINSAVRRERFRALTVSMEHAERAGRFDHPHRDPFDRMLAAQAMAEGLILISNETVFDRFGVNRVW